MRVRWIVLCTSLSRLAWGQAAPPPSAAVAPPPAPAAAPAAPPAAAAPAPVAAPAAPSAAPAAAPVQEPVREGRHAPPARVGFQMYISPLVGVSFPFGEG